MKKTEPWGQLPDSPNCVTIFGGGIAGLTAAHELCERGFRVQIWEPANDQRQPQRGCEIGGLARTQWSRTHWPDQRDFDNFDPGVSPSSLHDPYVQPFGVRTQPIIHMPQKLAIDRRELDQLSVRDPDGVYEGVEPYELPSGAQSWDWNGVELSVRDWETKSDDDRQKFAGFVVTAFKAAFHGITVSGPYFDRELQLWKVDLTMAAGTKTKRPLIFKGRFPTEVLQKRVPADVYGVFSFWQDDDKAGPGSARYQVNDMKLVLYQQWQPYLIRALGAWGSQETKAVLAEIVDTLMANREIRHVYVEVSDVDFKNLNDDERIARTNRVADAVRKDLPYGVSIETEGVDSEGPAEEKIRRIKSTLIIPGNPEQRIRLEVTPLSVYPSRTPEGTQVLIGFRIRERWLPGEHGYRFFPSFYRHIFDTMKRTPILDLTEKAAFFQQQEYAVNVDTPEPVRYVESTMTVFDNIHPTASHVLAFADGQRPIALSRSVPLSFTEVGEYIKVLFGAVENGGFAISPRESTRYSLKLFKYMTSCGDRRSEYEKISWWDFVGGDTYSQGIQDLLRKWPEALVAMNSKVADARSHGNAVVQLMLDNIRPRGYRDGTLRGPTSEAWFKYWRRYLEAQGVEFIHGKLTGFKVEGQRLLPQVECYEPRFPREEPNVGEIGNPLLMPGYFVLAVAADEAVELCKGLIEDSNYQSLQRPPFEHCAFAHVANIDASGLERAVPTGDFRHFAGIQFYFAEDVFWVDAHVYYPDSTWGLTSISQVRFWEDFTDWEHGFRGVISVIAATWDRPGKYTTDKCAWQCDEEEFAREVWAQIKNSVQGDRDGKDDAGSRYVVGSRARSGAVPDPLYWHIDDFLKYDEANGHFENAAPFHIASPEGWPRRPGDPARGYDVERGWVVCGMLAKTYTRIPTMEAANESARHAVNAILKQFELCRPEQRPRYRGTPCDIFDPEDLEVEDFKWFKDLDEKLFKRGQPHIVDILGLDRLTDTLLRGGESDPLDPINLSRQLSRLALTLPGILRKW